MLHQLQSADSAEEWAAADTMCCTAKGQQAFWTQHGPCHWFVGSEQLSRLLKSCPRAGYIVLGCVLLPISASEQHGCLAGYRVLPSNAFAWHGCTVSLPLQWAAVPAACPQPGLAAHCSNLRCGGCLASCPCRAQGAMAYKC